MTTPLTRPQQLQNAAFLKALRLTGNVREAARALGVHRSTFTKRRAKHPEFAARWDAALAVASAAAHAGTPARGEPRVVRAASGRLQLRRAVRGRLTREGEQRFLAALSATANIRLSAAAAGFTHGAFYQLAKRNAAFAREMRLALETGYERLGALLAGMEPAAYADDVWRHNDPPAIPPMTANQALQLMYLHHKTARLWAERPDMRKRRGETRDMVSWRLAGTYHLEQAKDAERWAVMRAEEDAARARKIADEPPQPALPDLSQVTGWSKAAPGPEPDADRALFGGKRINAAIRAPRYKTNRRS